MYCFSYRDNSFGNLFFHILWKQTYGHVATSSDWLNRNYYLLDNCSFGKTQLSLVEVIPLSQVSSTILQYLQANFKR